MNFQEAEKWHKEGKDTFRDNTNMNHLTWKADENELRFYNVSEDYSYNFDLEDINATDWQLCVEDLEDTWTAKKGFIPIDGYPEYLATLETLKEKILEDVEKEKFKDAKGRGTCIRLYDLDEILDKRIGTNGK